MRDLYVQEEHPYRASLAQGKLFWEALSEAVSILASGQHMRARGQELGWYGEGEPPEVRSILMSDIAQNIIDGAFSDGFYSPPRHTQWPRVGFALALDEQCSDAYLISGVLQEETGQDQLALVAYETSMRLAAERFGGEEALVERFANNKEEPLWYVTGGRHYLRPRSALAGLLWKLGEYKDAIAHYRAMLKLNPTDNQGNSDTLLCLLLEAGEDKALGTALKKFRTYTFSGGHTEVIADTIWHYTNACWRYRLWLKAQKTSESATAKQEADRALQGAFEHNRFVPMMLLAPEGLPALGELSHYSKGDGTEAAMYVNMALKAWQKIPGALKWLEEVAAQAHLLPDSKGKRKGTASKITINVVAQQEENTDQLL